MDDDRRDHGPQDDPTEALPTTQEMPLTAPLPTALNPEVAGGGDAAASVPPPSVPPLHDASRPAASLGDDGPRGRSPLLVGAAIAVAALVAAGLILGVGALLGASDSSVEVAASDSASPSASVETSSAPDESASEDSPAPSDTATADDDEASAAQVGSDGTPGSDGACTASVKNLKAKNGEFDLEIEIHARAGGVETWQVRVDLGEAIASEADHATLVDQADGIATVESEDGAKAIDSGKRFTFKVKGEGEPSGLDLACTS
ncbi:hypothetical protein [Demequina sp. NBRC 110054]|uniref:hypothetical protein n=1 Tax=Demequina sp. NBRC 110054 TaxID=1570343 RepID=UPI000A07A9F3|nr:hypothetical protein [Demequina sp. NBRC 110054]